MICVNAIQAYPTTLTLAVGDWYYDACASICPLNATYPCVTWHSSNSNVVTVSPSTGFIRAKAVGIAKVYATATDGSGCQDYILVTVKNIIPVCKIEMSIRAISLNPNKYYPLCTTLYPTNATTKTLAWSSSNPNVAEVSQDGIVHTLAVGKTVIKATATDGSGKYASCSINVTNNILISSISINGILKIMTEGTSSFIPITVRPNNACNCGVKWHSSDSTIATVNPDSGLVLAQNAGLTTIHVTALDGSLASASCTLIVLPANKTLSVGDTAYLVTGTLPNSNTVRWSSSDPCVATVSPTTGKITAQSEGTATITATAGNESAECFLHVVTSGYVTVISCVADDWVNSSGVMGTNMTSAMGADSQPEVQAPTDAFEFMDCWDQAGHCVIIHTHGGSNRLVGHTNDDNRPNIVSLEDIQNLEQNCNINFVMITACFTAGGDADDNIACWLSMKINPNGIVIGNKYVVGGTDSSFSATNELPGWVVYRNGAVICDELPVELTIETAYALYKSLMQE